MFESRGLNNIESAHEVHEWDYSVRPLMDNFHTLLTKIMHTEFNVAAPHQPPQEANVL